MTSIEDVRALLAQALEKLPHGAIAHAQAELGDAMVMLGQAVAGSTDSGIQEALGMAAQLEQELQTCLQIVESVKVAVDSYAVRL